MGQQQILLIVLSVILVGISVAVGITMFKGYSLSSNQDAIVYDMINIGSLAYQHRIRPSMLGGGNGSFENFQLPTGIDSNANADYSVVISEDKKEITITALSKLYTGAKITVKYDLNLEIVENFVKEGWDQ